jgi:poly-gamma-glutamate system protein
LREAARRNAAELKSFASLGEAIAARMELLESEGIRTIVNIGGGHASLGSCAHASSFPIGLWKRAPECACSERGVLTRSAHQGIKVIHLLQVRRLASMYGLDFEPGALYRNAGSIATARKPHVVWILAAISGIIVSMLIPGKRRP